MEIARKVLRNLDYSDNIELSLYLVADRTIKDLNKRYRGKDKATDVLSFNWPENCPSNLAGECLSLGDIVISIPTAGKNAEESKYSLDMELVVLLVHGILHLAGFDHENVDQETADIMLNIQNQLLGEVLEEWKA